SEALYRLLEFGRDLDRILAGFKTDRGPDFDRNLIGARHPSSCLLQIEQSINAHGDDRDSQVFYEQTDSRAESSNVAVRCVVSFGKYEHTKAAVHGLSHEGKAVTKAGFARKRNNIEQRDA